MPIAQDLMRPLTAAASATANYAVSDGGTLVYLSGPGLDSGAAIVTARTLVWVDRQGKEEPLGAPPRAYSYPCLSPDGTQVAVDIRDAESEIWVWLDRFPVWSPDGRRIAFSSARDRRSTANGDVFWQAADGTGQPEQLADDPRQTFPNAFSPDGAQLLVSGAPAGGDEDDDIGIVELGDVGPVKPLLEATFGERNADLSPDGRWLTYESDEAGQLEVYVRPFPNIDAGRWQVSTTGGSQPVWARNGRELFYRNGDALMSVAVERGESFEFGNPVELFRGAYAPTLGGRNYDVSPDGRRFLMLKVSSAGTSEEARPPTRFIVVQNFFEELRQRVPVSR